MTKTKTFLRQKTLTQLNYKSAAKINTANQKFCASLVSAYIALRQPWVTSQHGRLWNDHQVSPKTPAVIVAQKISVLQETKLCFSVHMEKPLTVFKNLHLRTSLPKHFKWPKIVFACGQKAKLYINKQLFKNTHLHVAMASNRVRIQVDKGV